MAVNLVDAPLQHKACQLFFAKKAKESPAAAEWQPAAPASGKDSGKTCRPAANSQ
jgi:hypothetical protein